MSSSTGVQTRVLTDLPAALKYFVHWTGFHREWKLYKSGRHVATVFRRPYPPHEKCCVTLKRDWYKNFSFHFPQCPEKGWGQITSLKLLRCCEQQGISWLVAVMPNGVGYKIEVSEFLRYYEQYKTEVPHLPGEVAAPIKMWKRMFPG